MVVVVLFGRRQLQAAAGEIHSRSTPITIIVNIAPIRIIVPVAPNKPIPVFADNSPSDFRKSMAVITTKTNKTTNAKSMFVMKFPIMLETHVCPVNLCQCCPFCSVPNARYSNFGKEAKERIDSYNRDEYYAYNGCDYSVESIVEDATFSVMAC